MGDLFAQGVLQYYPKAPEGFLPERIILAKGSCSGPERRQLAEKICSAFPQAEVIRREDLPHNRIEVGADAPLGRHLQGKKTLVLGEHKSALRFSREEGNTCPNYWHFSPYGFCPYGCTYCYLAGTQGIWFSPTVKIFLNLPEILDQIGRIADEQATPQAFYLGKLQDALALDPLTGYSRTMIPFFARHSFARMTLLTKSADVENLLDLDHRGRTILSWSLNPPEVAKQFEPGAPSPRARLAAMKKCADAGYPVRAIIMPLIPVVNWREAYEALVRELLVVPLDRITLGGICIYTNAKRLMEVKIGSGNVVSSAMEATPHKEADGRRRYPRDLRVRMYGHLLSVIQSVRPDLPVSLCLEEREVFRRLGLTESIGRCNCVL